MISFLHLCFWFLQILIRLLSCPKKKVIKICLCFRSTAVHLIGTGVLLFSTTWKAVQLTLKLIRWMGEYIVFDIYYLGNIPCLEVSKIFYLEYDHMSHMVYAVNGHFTANIGLSEKSCIFLCFSKGIYWYKEQISVIHYSFFRNPFTFF